MFCLNCDYLRTLKTKLHCDEQSKYNILQVNMVICNVILNDKEEIYQITVYVNIIVSKLYKDHHKINSKIKLFRTTRNVTRVGYYQIVGQFNVSQDAKYHSRKNKSFKSSERIQRCY